MTNTPPEVLEKWRKDAEEFYSNEYCTDKNTDPDQDSYYVDQFLDLKVSAFIDGRQTAVIELQKANVEYDGMDEPSYYYRPSQIKRAIESQGYTVEVKS